MQKYNGVRDHIRHKGGTKTVCVSTVLGELGINPDSYHYSGKLTQFSAVLRRNGYAVRSRQSVTKAATTVGALRPLIRKGTTKWGDPETVKYLVCVRCGNGENHLILLDRDGDTLIDTAPVKRDRRRILKVMATYKA